MTFAAAALGAASYGLWWLLDQALGDALLAQMVAVTAALLAGIAVYAAVVLAARVPEARQLRSRAQGLLRRRR
jgi:hypothetical protein